MEHPAWLYDGENALRHEVSVGRSGSDLLLRFADGSSLAVAPDRLAHVESRRDCEIYGRSDVPGWRLGMTSEPPPEVAQLLPGKTRYGRWIDRIGLTRALIVFVVASAAVLFALNRFPGWVAPYIPESWEETYGDTLVGDFGGRFCNGPGGQAALDKLARRLSPEAGKLNIRVVHIGMVNAAALPGGNIVIFDELLDQADGPDEVAGVLAHEIGHIEEHHVTQTMVRELGLGLIVTAFGGNTGANVHNVMSVSYSRKAEGEADGDAIATLARAGISPAPTAAFFERMARREKALGRLATGLSYLSSHPMSADREKRFRGSAVPGRAYTPALSPAEWRALAGICRDDEGEKSVTSR